MFFNKFFFDADLNIEDANIMSPQDWGDARLFGVIGSPSLVRIPVSKQR